MDGDELTVNQKEVVHFQLCIQVLEQSICIVVMPTGVHKRSDVCTTKQQIIDLCGAVEMIWHAMNALHIASLRGNKRICQLIIDKTSKTSNALSILNARDKQGRTPLDICNNPSVARILEPAASA